MRMDGVPVDRHPVDVKLGARQQHVIGGDDLAHQRELDEALGELAAEPGR
ncbi:MAG: hypothetical protein ACYSW2_08360 [Planctomycetota bacterium]|jgi:hypothetical protein